MSTDNRIDRFDVATACEHIPSGETMLRMVDPDTMELLASAVTADRKRFKAIAQQHGIGPNGIAELWYWFHPAEYDTDMYHRLRDDAAGQQPRA